MTIATAAVLRRIAASLSVAGNILLACAANPAVADSDRSWRIGWANDEFVGSDNQFTNGAFLEVHSALSDSLAGTSGTPAFGKAIAASFLPERAGLHYRETWTAAHNMQTPDDIDRSDLILTDVPYLAMIGWTNSFYAFDDREMTGFQTMLGWVGDAALGEPIQSATHEITGATEPRGWSNQLDDEPLINVYAMRKRKFFANDWMDAAWNLDAALGNFFTHGQAALELRFGDRPAGFAPTALPVGHMLEHDARIRTAGPGHFYASAILRATGFLYAMPRDGNFLRGDNRWTENQRIDTEDIVGQLVFGLHYERQRWGVHLVFNLATDAVEPATGNLADPSNNFGVLMLERSF